MQTQLTCPACQTPFMGEVFQIVDVGLQPEMKQMLLTGALNVVQCPACGTATRAGPGEPRKGRPLVYAGRPSPRHRRKGVRILLSGSSPRRGAGRSGRGEYDGCYPCQRYWYTHIRRIISLCPGLIKPNEGSGKKSGRVKISCRPCSTIAFFALPFGRPSG